MVVSAFMAYRRIGCFLDRMHLLSDDVMSVSALQCAQIIFRGETTIHDTDHESVFPAGQVFFHFFNPPHISDVLPGRTQDRTEMPSRVTANQIATCIISERLSLKNPRRRDVASSDDSMNITAYKITCITHKNSVYFSKRRLMIFR